jgi:branched-chain amino acid transport system ATP-binding protein
VISAQSVGWSVGGARILDDVTLSVGAGELLGIIGPNGAGKSSLVNILSGVTRPTKGRITLRDEDVTRASATRRARRGLARSFQTSALFDGLTAGENVRLAVQAAGRAPFSPFRRAGSRGSEAAGRVGALLARVRMRGRDDTLARDLSHGDRRKLELAMALAAEPAVLLLDEPMAGVSAEDVDGLTEIIGDVRDSGVAVAMVEHHMHVVLGLADRVAVLHHGRLLAVGAPAEVTADERVQQAYLGEAL